MLPIFPALIFAAAAFGESLPLPVNAPTSTKVPTWREGADGLELGSDLPVQRKLFGVGVGFERSGNAHGVPLSTVLPGSPADRAGFMVGMVIAEINGETTVGKTGDACAQLIREGGAVVTIKFYDAGTLRLRTIKLEKESLKLP